MATPIKTRPRDFIRRHFGWLVFGGVSGYVIVSGLTQPSSPRPGISLTTSLPSLVSSAVAAEA
ncbi:MAG TPA: hypothetical protein VIT21_11745, partial [Chthoniobacterales bacterium]